MKRIDPRGARLAILWALHRLRLPAQQAHRVLLGGVGARFRLGRGSCVVARRATIGDRVRIGRGCSIAAEEIVIGDDVTIGDNVSIRTRRLVLGNHSRIDAETTVYGLTTPRAGLELGEHAWIYAKCHINSDELVSIGPRTAAGSHCLIFTHSSYLPITQGYPVTIAPVTIGAGVWLPWHAFILPGARIGDGATVGAFSLVSGEIPANSLAVGVPARIVKDAASYRRRYDDTGMRTLAERVVRTSVENTAGAFVPASLFFPRQRAHRELAPGLWEIAGDGATLIVALRSALQGDVPAGALHVTHGTDGEGVPADASWIDVATLQSRLLGPESALRRDFLAQLSNYGIRFGWLPANEAAQPPG